MSFFSERYRIISFFVILSMSFNIYTNLIKNNTEENKVTVLCHGKAYLKMNERITRGIIWLSLVESHAWVFAAYFQNYISGTLFFRFVQHFL